MAGRQALLLQILLVVILSLEERYCWNDLSDYGLTKTMGVFQLLLRSFGGGFLLWSMKEDSRTILLAPVRPLPVELRGIVVLPEDVEQLVIRKLGGIVIEFDRFGMTGRIRAHRLIGRIGRIAAGVADARRDHSGHLAKGRFDSPETACRKSSFSH